MIRNSPLKNYYDEVLRLVPDGSASGSIASFDDGAKDCPLKSLKVGIEPIQSGSGTPSPSNVRAISPRSSVEVTRTGVNVWDEEWEVGNINSSGNPYNDSTAIRSKNYIAVKEGETYYFKTSYALKVRLYDSNKVFVSAPAWPVGNVYVLTVPEGVGYVRFATQSNYGDVYLHDISINYPSTDTAYHKSDVQTYAINLGQSIYGGTLDVGKGELVIDKALVDLSNISASGSKDSNLWRIESSSPMYPTDNAYKVGFCDKLVFKQSYEAVNENDGSIAFSRNNGTLIILRNDAITTAADAVDFAKALQVVYPITNPTTVTLTPTEIRTLYGINNLWSDSGNVEVTYKANATLLYEKIRNAIIAQGGQI